MTAPGAARHQTEAAADRLADLWRRSGGQLEAAQPGVVESRILEQLQSVRSWDDFLAARVTVDVEGVVPPDMRHQLDNPPTSVHLFGDRAAIEVGKRSL